MEWKYSEDKKRIVIEPPKAKLRITGHRISTIVGVNKWSTPFQAWCEITKLLKAPFEESKYTLFGKAVEPKLIEYVGQKYPNVMSIEDYYGNVFEDYRWNNFKDDSNIFGGVIDAVSTRNDGKTIAMICECKTSSHPEQWANGQVPVDYLLQGALYSYLKGLDRVLFICTFPQEIDYAHPENYVVNEKNTIMVVKQLKDILVEIDGKYLNIEEIMEYGKQWWDAYITTGISPEFDEKADKEYLDMIRASKPCEDNDLMDVCKEAINLAREIKELEVSSGLKAKNDLLKTLEASIKETMMSQGLSNAGNYKMTATQKDKFDEKKFAKDNPDIYKKYVEVKTEYRLSKSLKEEEE